MSENKILVTVSERLGLRDEQSIYKKAEEFHRVLQSKSLVNTINDYAKAILCFDLATSILRIPFDQETALKLSGFKMPAYKKNLNILKKLLEVDKPLTIGEICVKFSCTVAKELAEKILTAYKEQGIPRDFSHPQYVAVSVATACKLKKFKIQKSEFSSISCLKPNQWKQLETEFLDFALKIGLSTETKKKTGKNELQNCLEEFIQNNENKSPKKKQSEEKPVELYEVWKQRILEEAREKLKSEN